MTTLRRLPKGLIIDTRVINGVNTVTATLYSTAIVIIESIPSGEKLVTFNDGGWNTNHTKKCTNLILGLYNLPMYIYQKDFIWYIEHKITNKIYNYNDNSELAA